MDFNLGQRNTKHYLLRADLGFKEVVPFYYLAVVLDILLRFSWIVYLPPSPHFSVQLRGFILALLEAIRRIMWNSLRFVVPFFLSSFISDFLLSSSSVESEHLGNLDSFRVTRTVPLPYLITNKPPEDEDDEDRPGRTGLFSFFTNEIPPLASINLTQYVPGVSSTMSRRPSSASLGGGAGGRQGAAKDYERKKSQGTNPDSSDADSAGDDDPDTPSDEAEDSDEQGGNATLGGLQPKPGGSSR